VAVRYADANLVTLPDAMTSITAASLGCRLATAYRAVAQQARVHSGEWVAVFGCGGVGLSAVMVARALGARVIAIDVRSEPLAKAQQCGAEHCVDASQIDDVPAAITELTGGGAHVSLDCLGHRTTMRNAILSLARRGRHVQVGLLAGADADPATPWGRVIGWELQLVGSHGMAAASYPELFAPIAAGQIDPTQLIDRTLSLAEAPAALASLDSYSGCGVAVIVP
jgi:alcohol dehydrogenase